MDGLYYEPRSFWSIANVLGSTVTQQVTLDKKHFFNGERHPIEIRRIAIAGINYVVTGPPLLTGEDPQIGANETADVISRTRVRISTAQRYHFNTRKFVVDAGLAPMATGQPRATLDVADNPRSSLWGQCSLKLDQPLIVPRNGACEWQMSAYTPWQGHAGAEPEVNQNEPTTAWLMYQEVGGLFVGSSRARQIDLLPFVGGSTVPTDDAWPYPPDGYGTGPVSGGIQTSSTWWPPQSNFPAGGRAGNTSVARGFRDQGSNRDGSSEITGLRTYIDQVDYDTSFIENAFASARQPTPLSLRTGCRIRTSGSGSGVWWWRPGAPLALVFDHITPAVVYELPRPFTMGPGEQIVVEMELPPNVIADPVITGTTFHVGVSLNGFAAIEG